VSRCRPQFCRSVRGRLRLPTLIPVFLALCPVAGRAADSSAAIVADLTSNQVLFSQAAEEPRFPASLTKMMTLYLLFEDLERRRCALETSLVVSEYAAAQTPTKLGLQSGETIRVEDAIRALVTHSANDAAVAVAENLEGSEPAFAARMTRTAQQLGMTRTQFRNASGLPNPEQYSTARDMMVLGAALQARFPRYFAYFKTDSFTFRGRAYRNHNRLLGRVEGVDGIKTGYTRSSGFNLVTSVRRGGRTFVAVVMGWPTAKSRDRQMETLIGSYVPGAAVASTDGQKRPERLADTQAGPSPAASRSKRAAAAPSKAQQANVPTKAREANASSE
jgi:D-alanyl-D-alanine carboxypeptidase